MDLERLTVLVGPNSSGKTSVLEGIHLLFQLVEKAPGELFTGKQRPGFLKSKGIDESSALVFGGEWSDVAYSVGVSKEDAGVLDCSLEIQWKGSKNSITAVQEEIRRLSQYHGDAIAVVGSSVLLHLDPMKLAEPSYSHDPSPRMDSTGEGLASVLAEMAVSRPNQFQALREAIGAVVPVQQVRLERAQVNTPMIEFHVIDGKDVANRVERNYWGHQLLFDMIGAEGIPGHAVSEGTILVLGMLTAIVKPNPPRMLLIENIDHGLHPLALGNLVKQIRKLQDLHKDLQIVATSHSPYLLDHVQAEEVRLTAMNADGSAACAPLVEHPEFDKWKDSMAPGEFWSTVGEDWIKEGGNGEDA